ncbi:MAG: FAD-dependent oxidoreductase [Gammaproteobacteria bacterium]|nr:FAD-dependent oxidoreductase [Gammaproteobacteria bacterium]
MKPSYELLIIGAGPAGMSAACEAARNGVAVCVIDDQPEPGGQIYRNASRATDKQNQVLGKDYQQGKNLVDDFKSYGGEYYANASVWHVDANNQVGVIKAGKNYFISAKNLVIASGAQERAMPIPGWQLPGVMYAGAGQILFKGSGIVPTGELVLAGTGPLLLLLASQYLHAGVKIKAILDTTPKGRIVKSLDKLFSGVQGYEYLIKGASLLRHIKAAKVPYYKHVEGLCAVGVERVEKVSFASATKAGRKVANISLDVDTLLLHQGIIPNTRLARAAQCETTWDAQQSCWIVATNEYGLCRQNTYVVGDAARVMGAVASRIQGRLCGLHVAQSLTKVDSHSWQVWHKDLLKKLRKENAIRPFLDAVYQPADAYLIPQQDDVIVCRCEEVTLSDIQDAVRLGCQGPNQVKSYTRCGMGPCQGTQCSNTLSHIVAKQSNMPMAQVGELRVRSPLSPITLGQIADL